jgi:hypothetical protein
VTVRAPIALCGVTYPIMVLFCCVQGVAPLLSLPMTVRVIVESVSTSRTFLGMLQPT